MRFVCMIFMLIPLSIIAQNNDTIRAENIKYKPTFFIDGFVGNPQYYTYSGLIGQHRLAKGSRIEMFSPQPMLRIRSGICLFKKGNSRLLTGLALNSYKIHLFISEFPDSIFRYTTVLKGVQNIQFELPLILERTVFNNENSNVSALFGVSFMKGYAYEYFNERIEKESISSVIKSKTECNLSADKLGLIEIGVNAAFKNKNNSFHIGAIYQRMVVSAGGGNGFYIEYQFNQFNYRYSFDYKYQVLGFYLKYEFSAN